MQPLRSSQAACSQHPCCVRRSLPPRTPQPSSRSLACRAGKPRDQQPATRQQHQHQGRLRAAGPRSRLSVDKQQQQQQNGTGDADKEQSRKFRRVTFDHELWAKHRSTGRYWRHIQSMTRSRVVKALAIPLAYVGTVATIVCCYEALLEKQLLPDWGFDWPGLAVSTTGVYSLSTFALSLLLVFRTNSSYQRWNDARKLWGLTTNRCRDLSRQVQQWMTDPCDAQLAAAACRFIRAFPIALMASLRIDHDLQRDLSSVLQPQELQLIASQPHTGTAILQALGAVVAASSIKEAQKLRIDENITCLQDTMGGCERIFRTPIPLVYTRHTSRFLLCWLTILPFCTAGQVGWLTVPIACVMAFFLLGIEEIGVQVEEPFGILALEQFCENISKNVQQAENAAAAMRTVAAAHALQQLPQPQQRQAAHRSTSLTPNSSSRSRTPQSRSSSSSSSMPSLQLPQPPAGLVAGSEVPAAEQAHSIGGPVGLPPHAAAQQAQAQVLCLPTGVAPDGTCDGLAAAASGLAADSWASRGGAAAGDDDEPSYYFPSSVSSGASAGDSEDPF